MSFDFVHGIFCHVIFYIIKYHPSCAVYKKMVNYKIKGKEFKKSVKIYTGL